MGKCCHPLLLWMLNIMLIISTGVMCIVLLLTTFASRSKRTFERRKITAFTLAEECSLAHLAFTIMYGVFVNFAMRLISSGGHRDHFYRIEKDFKIVCGLILLSSLMVAILGIVLYVYRESALQFTTAAGGGGPTTVSAIQDWFGHITTGRGPTLLEERTADVNVYILYLLIADIGNLVLSAVGVGIILGCNRRERYDVELAVERSMMSRGGSRTTSRSALSSRASSHHHIRS